MTLAELKAMHAAMKAPIGAYAITRAEQGMHVHLLLDLATARGVVALHNHFAALYERYEAMRVALREAERQGYLESGRRCCPICDREKSHSTTCSLGDALALADQPLEVAAS